MIEAGNVANTNTAARGGGPPVTIVTAAAPAWQMAPELCRCGVADRACVHEKQHSKRLMPIVSVAVVPSYCCRRRRCYLRLGQCIRQRRAPSADRWRNTRGTNFASMSSTDSTVLPAVAMITRPIECPTSDEPLAFSPAPQLATAKENASCR